MSTRLYTCNFTPFEEEHIQNRITLARNAVLGKCLIIIDQHIQGHAGPQYRAACENIGREIAALCTVSRPQSGGPNA